MYGKKSFLLQLISYSVTLDFVACGFMVMVAPEDDVTVLSAVMTSFPVPTGSCDVTDRVVIDRPQGSRGSLSDLLYFFVHCSCLLHLSVTT